MSASNEKFEYHLTENGWVGGSQKLDFQGWIHRDPPEGRLLTVEFSEYLASSYSKMDWSADISEFADSEAIKTSLQKFGGNPHAGPKRFREWVEYLAEQGIKVDE